MFKKRPFIFQGIDFDRWRVVDGDSIIVVVSTGDNDTKCRRLRLHRLDVPEISKNASDLEREAGTAVSNWTKNLLTKLIPIASEIDVISEVKPDAYGHWLGDIRIDDLYLSSELLRLELARPYDGKKKLPWTNEQLNMIINHLKN